MRFSPVNLPHLINDDRDKTTSDLSACGLQPSLVLTGYAAKQPLKGQVTSLLYHFTRPSNFQVQSETHKTEFSSPAPERRGRGPRGHGVRGCGVLDFSKSEPGRFRAPRGASSRLFHRARAKGVGLGAGRTFAPKLSCWSKITEIADVFSADFSECGKLSSGSCGGDSHELVGSKPVLEYGSAQGAQKTGIGDEVGCLSRSGPLVGSPVRV